MTRSSTSSHILATALIAAPVTSDFTAWYAETGVFFLAVVAAIGGFGYWTALAGRPFAATLAGLESAASGSRG